MMPKQISETIAWISGAIAALNAVFYGLGFLASNAANQVLGISIEFSSRDPTTYILRTGDMLVRTAILAIWPVLLLFISANLFRWIRRVFRISERRRLGFIRRSARTAAAPLTALAMLFFAFYVPAGLVAESLSVESMLSAAGRQQEFCQEKYAVLEYAILTQDRDFLNLSYAKVALSLGLIAGIGMIGWPALASANRRIWLAIAIIACVAALITMPIAYGTLAMERSAPEVEINPKPEKAGSLLLLSRTENGLLAWDESIGKIYWIENKQIESIVLGPKRLVRIPCPERLGAGQAVRP